VAATLEDLEFKLDHVPAEALRDISEALMKIADRYCQYRIGELLDGGELVSVPERDWDYVRYIVATVLSVGGVMALALSGVIPDGVQDFVYFCVVIVCVLIVFRRRFRHALDVLGSIAGGP
jgi:hypothetical protein